MGLIHPSGPSWAYCSHNFNATPAVATVGTSITSGTGNADGSDTAALSALAHDVEHLRIVLTGTFTTA